MPSAFEHGPTLTVVASPTANAGVIWSAANNLGQSTVLLGTGTIGISGDTDIITLTANTVTVAGTLAATTLTGALNGSQLVNDSIVEGKLNVSNAPTNGHVLTARDGVAGGFTWEAASAGATLSGSTDNTIVTVTGSNAMIGESTLTYDASGSTNDLNFGSDSAKITMRGGRIESPSNSLMRFYTTNELLLAMDTGYTPAPGRITIFAPHTVHQAAGEVKLILKDTSNDNANGVTVLEYERSGGDGNNAYIGYGNSSNEIFYVVQERNADMKFYTNGTSRLIIAANGTLSGSSTNDISDERLKENIVASDIGLAEVLQLRPVSFNFKVGKGWGEPGQKFYGLIAQEAEAIIPESVTTGGEGSYDDQHPDADELDYLKSLSMSQITTALIKAVQELNAKVDAL